MKSRRITLVLPEPPLPFGSASSRWYYVLLKGLVERGHRVTALAAASDPSEIPRAAELFPAPDYQLRCFPLPRRSGLGAKLETLRRPYSYVFGEEVRGLVADELRAGCEVLHLEQLWTGWLGVGVPERALVNVHHLYGIDLEQSRPDGVAARLERRLLIHSERRLLRKLRHVIAVSPRLAATVRALHPGASASAVPLTLDVERYAQVAPATRPVVSVIGNMRWAPSRSAAERLLSRLFPAIRAQVPEAEALVVGWSARRALSAFLDRPGVRIVEDVPEIEPYFAASQVLLYAPGRGSGVKVKLLEALAYGVPVVTNREGAEGIPGVDGVHFSLAEDDATLVARTVALLGDPAEREARRANGRRLLEQELTPARALDELERVYDRIVERTGRTR